MAAPCHAKMRFATKAFAETVIANRLGSDRYHPAKAKYLQAYYCARCGAWHLGHSHFASNSHDSGGGHLDALGRLHTLRANLVADYGRTKRPGDWAGVRILTRTIQHLKNRA